MPLSLTNLSNIEHPGYVSGRYYQGFRDASADTSSTAAFTINFITYYLFTVYHQITLTRLGIYVAGSVSGANVRLRIYSNQNGIPLNLLADGGNIIAASPGAKEAIISLPLTPGNYWLGGTTTVAPSLYSAISFLGTNHDLGQSAPSSVLATCGQRNTIAVSPDALGSEAPTDNLQLITGNIRPFFWFKVA
ncbi:hypothetical protein HUN01_06845 [Nostoc edaphicum CCNP1411]|uniref:Uncharacterized protein n=1 Tax=Nostoc edaphicum CCNP1411 TaxID=1472755 RepID=A0A7D7LB31_9NOSO|nr:hypothetical protein [Nostoc edaphicum]QMS87314.1 hypothetical protein HUN01_06845 [Nostoc edaphicum CCNP1411]